MKSENDDQRPELNVMEHAEVDHHRDQKLDDTTHALAEEKKKRRTKPLLILVIALLLAIMGGIATLAIYKAYFEKPAAQTAQSTTSQQTKPKVTAAAALTAIVQAVGGAEAAGTSPIQAPAQKAASGDYYVQPSGGTTDNQTASRILSADQSGKAMASVGEALIAKGFSKKDFTTTGADLAYVTYTSASAACAVEATRNSDTAANVTVAAACTDNSVYQRLSKNTKQYADVYVKANTEQASDQRKALFVGVPAPVDSRTPGYRTADATMSVYYDAEYMYGEFQGLFYQTPDKVWHYFKGVQQIVDCSQYSTTDLKKAYLGEPCMGEGTNEAKVTL